MDRKRLSKKIRLVRIELDLIQTQLTQRINTQQKNISRYETRASLSSVETVVKITKALKKPAGYFLDGQSGEELAFVFREIVGASKKSERVTELLLDDQQRLTA